MKFEVEKAFAKDFRKLKNRELAIAISESITQVSEASTIKEIANLKKLTGYKSAFRIRIGDYRIGVTIEKSIVTFVAFAHRSHFDVLTFYRKLFNECAATHKLIFLRN